MKILVVGGGGREHALVWRLSKSPRVNEIYCAPGNAGIASIAHCVDVGATDIERLVAFAKEIEIDLTIVGPEGPLCRGIVDRFEAEDLRIFGPRKSAAELEGSKTFCKRLMTDYLIPTAAGRSFDEYERALQYVETADYPLVIKADGLAAGKGVFIPTCFDEAKQALEACLIEKRFGDAGDLVLVEEHLQGIEASVFAFTDGRTIAVLPTARDYKRIHDDDEGPNTGGMGSYSPNVAMTESIMDQVVGQILVPVVHALNREGRTYKGVLYAGLMLTKGGPKVLEFNVRFGDPETQPVMMRLNTDLVDLMDAVIDERLEGTELDYDERPACSVVMASEGYPGPTRVGRRIEGLDAVGAGDDLQVFHAGTAFSKEGDHVITSGGRVLAATALGKTHEDARARAYAAVEKISFQGAQYRRDIGRQARLRRDRPGFGETGRR